MAVSPTLVIFYMSAFTFKSNSTISFVPYLQACISAVLPNKSVISTSAPSSIKERATAVLLFSIATINGVR